jgi:hypothetical protein
MSNSVSLVTVLVSASVSATTGYIVWRLSQRLQDRKATFRWRLAIVSEIRTLRTRLMHYELAFERRVVTGEISGSEVLRVLLPPGDISVFTHSAPSIGLFDTRTALRVLRFYADVRTLQGHALILAEVASKSGARPAASDILQHRTMLRRSQLRAHILIRRLRGEARALAFVRALWRGASVPRGIGALCKYRSKCEEPEALDVQHPWRKETP